MVRSAYSSGHPSVGVGECHKTKVTLVVAYHSLFRIPTCWPLLLRVLRVLNCARIEVAPGLFHSPRRPWSLIRPPNCTTCLAHQHGPPPNTYPHPPHCTKPGAGNTPAVIDETANVNLAVSSILLSKTFDNGVICSTEQSVVVVDSM